MLTRGQANISSYWKARNTYTKEAAINEDVRNPGVTGYKVFNLHQVGAGG